MRDTWEQVFLKMAELLASRSTCGRVKVGAVLTRDNRVVSTGYNGVPAGEPHCEDLGFVNHTSHGEYSRTHELHAELNAVLYAARHGVPTGGTTLYMTLSPCVACAKALYQAGVVRVVYRDTYDRETDGVDFLNTHGVPCEKIEAAT